MCDPAFGMQFGDRSVRRNPLRRRSDFLGIFLSLVFKQNPDAMQKRDIKAVLPMVCSTFNVKTRPFAPSDKAPYYKEEDF